MIVLAYLALALPVIYLIGSRFRRHQKYYPEPKRRHKDRTPTWGGRTWNLDDGPPGGPRGRIWTELERDQYREKMRNKVIRIQTRMW